MELTVELIGSKPFNPKGLAEREGFYTAVPKSPTRLAKSLLLKDRVSAHC
jgi:hypothetical protein